MPPFGVNVPGFIVGRFLTIAEELTMAQQDCDSFKHHSSEGVRFRRILF
jgi:hypothetical protein